MAKKLDVHFIWNDCFWSNSYYEERTRTFFKASQCNLSSNGTFDTESIINSPEIEKTKVSNFWYKYGGQKRPKKSIIIYGQPLRILKKIDFGSVSLFYIGAVSTKERSFYIIIVFSFGLFYQRSKKWQILHCVKGKSKAGERAGQN